MSLETIMNAVTVVGVVLIVFGVLRWAVRVNAKLTLLYSVYNETRRLALKVSNLEAKIAKLERDMQAGE